MALVQVQLEKAKKKSDLGQSKNIYLLECWSKSKLLQFLGNSFVNDEEWMLLYDILGLIFFPFFWKITQTDCRIEKGQTIL